jgi:hypothetical protein
MSAVGSQATIKAIRRGANGAAYTSVDDEAATSRR